MKINDIVLKEGPMNAQQLKAAQDAAAGRPQAPTAAPSAAPAAGTGLAGNNKNPTQDPNNPQKKSQTKKVKTNKVQPKKPVDAMAGADAGDQQTSNYTGQVQTSTPAPTGQAAPSAELDRLKQLAIGGEQPAPAPEAPYGGAAANAMAAKSAPTPPPQANALGIQAQSGAAFGQSAPQADNPNPPAAAPAPAPAPAPEPAQAAQPAPIQTAQDFAGTPATNPDTGLSTAPKPVTTGTGAKTNITTGSDDEMAWRSKQTGIVDVTKYPGAGNWDPKTGRTKQDPNKPGFFDRLFGKKQAPAVASGPQGQTAQPMVPSNFAESNSEIDRIKKLSGLK